MMISRTAWRAGLGILLALVFSLPSLTASAAPKAEVWPRWTAHDGASTATIDRAAWDRFLAANLVLGRDGISRVAYGNLSRADRRALARYVDALAAVPISRHRRAEQLAYWINLYNALTIKVVLDHYPVKSIREINISPGWFSIGGMSRVMAGRRRSPGAVRLRVLSDDRLHGTRLPPKPWNIHCRCRCRRYRMPTRIFA